MMIPSDSEPFLMEYLTPMNEIENDVVGNVFDEM